MAREYQLRPRPGQSSLDGKLTDESPMPFGKHKSVPLKDVPASYLLWLWNNGVHAEAHKPIHVYIKDNISAIEMDAPDVDY